MATGDPRTARPRGGGTALPADPLDVANRLRPVLLHLSRHLRRETHALGLTSGQASVLAAIRSTPGIGVNELAAREGMAAPSMSGHVDRLEAAGLVARLRAESGDRRRVGLTVTRDGVRALDDVRRRRTAWLAQRLKNLDPGELDRIDAAIEALAGIVEVQP
jgi:DNA-binding MarR family transcriptional regulator